MGKQHKWAKEIHAWAAGATIQEQWDYEDWKDVKEPEWDKDVSFRIKPSKRSIKPQLQINLTKKEVNLIIYLAGLKVDTNPYADVNQELRSILKKLNLALDKQAKV